jgi:amino acid adenylation domain-containing protein/non-ribosomal peptide synthase protein (TIGR01720 family)
MLAHQLRASAPGVDIEQVVVTLPERVDAAALGAAWQRLVDHYDVLRTAFVWEGVDAPEQRVAPEAVLPLEVHDWTTTPGAARDAALAAFLNEDRRRGLPLDVAPLMRVTIGRWSADEAVLVWTFHHALLDGRCFPVLLREAFASYEAARDGRALPVLPERGDFAEFAAWVARRDVAASDAFWRAMVGEVSSPTAIPVLRAVAPGVAAEQGDAERWVDAAAVTSLRALAERAGVTLNTVVQAAWALVLARYSGEAHVTFGVTRAGRRDTVPGADEMLGLFITTVPMRVAVPDDATVVEWLRAVRAQWTALAPHEHTPLARIQSLSGVGAGRPLFESIVMFEQYELDARMRAEGGAWAKRAVRLHEQNGFALTLAAYADERMLLRLEFDRSRVDDDAVQRMLAHLATGLSSLVAQADASVATLNVLPADERAQLLEGWAGRSTPRSEDTLAHRLAAQARATPLAVAVSDERRSLTYAELESATCALARRLRAEGVGARVRVGVAVERSVELVVSLLAVVRAGGCYVPIDPEYPADRVRFMLEDARVTALLTSEDVRSTLPPTSARVLPVDGCARLRDAADAEPLPMPRADDPAYMIYTSGSTGRPKGAVNAHRGIVNRLQWMQDEYALTAADLVLQKTPFSFDVSVWEFFWPLMTGARLVMARPGGHRDTQYLAEVMTQHGVTVCHFVPAMLRAFLADAASARCTTLRDVMASGEALPPDVVAAFYTALPDARLHNLYGPTECAVDVSYWPCPSSVVPPALVPIGRAVANTRLYVLDARGRVCPIGVPGELFLAGVQVGMGYHDRPELTAERFVRDPFAPADEPKPRMYRTGDQARWRADGTVEYLGRLDFQVKIRGFRIELGEIEAALLAHPQLADAVVTAHEAPGAEKRLVAYVVAKGEAPTVGALRDHLLTTLPDYMVPALFVWLEALPLSSNGKVDRRALPEPEAVRVDAARALVAPRSEAEAAIAAAWAAVLRVEAVSVEDNFFELGGDSLLAIQLISRVARAGFTLSLTDALKHPTVAGQATVARPRAVAAVVAEAVDVPVPALTAVPLTPVQAWFAELDPADAHHWNQGFAFAVEPSLDLARFERAVQAVAAHHDAFRLRFARGSDGTWRQWYAAEPAYGFERVTLPMGDAAVEITAAARRAQQALDLERGPLVRVVVMTRAGAAVRVALVAHHLVVDGVSWRVLREDMDQAYAPLAAGAAVTLAPAGRWLAWSEAVSREAGSARLGAEADYWRAQVAPGAAAVPAARANGANVEGDVGIAVARLTADETSALLQRVPAAYGTRINDALLAALDGALAAWMGDATVLVDLEGHGREELGADVARTVGWFTSVFPVRMDVKRGATPRARLVAAKERLRAMPRNGVGFGILRYTARDAALASGAPASVLFNYLGQFDQVVAGSALFRFAPESAGAWRSARARRRHELEVNGVVQDGALEVRFAYAKARQDASAMEALASSFASALRAIIAHATAPSAGGYTPSDFPMAGLDQAALDKLFPVRGGAADIYPLTPVQRLFLDGVGAAGDPGVQQYVFPLDGAVNQDALLEAWNAVVRAHPALRTRFVLGAAPLQVVLPDVAVTAAEEDFTAVPSDVREARVADWLAADRERGFDAAQAPLMRIALLRVDAQRTLLVWTQHHLILDRWSWPRVLQQVGAQYATRVGGGAAPSLSAPSFRDAVAAIVAPPSEAAERYWRDQLAEMRTVGRVLGAPAGDPASAATFRDLAVTLDVATTARLTQAARSRGLGLNTLVQGAWALVLARLTGTHDVTFGLAVAGRALDVPAVDEIIGVLINNVPVRARLDGDAEVDAWLSALQARQADLRVAEQVSPEQLQQWSGLPWGQRLFESLVVFQDAGVEAGMRDWFGPTLTVGTPVTPTETAYPITLLVTGSERLAVQLRLDARWVSAPLGDALAAQLDAALRALADVRQSTVQALLERLPASTTGAVRGVERAPIVSPRDDVERVLARQWAAVFGLAEVGVTESFFALGGTSLAATQLVSRVRENFQLELPVRAVFESPTVEGLARALVARERRPGQVRRIAQLILEVDAMSAEELAAPATPPSENPVPGVPK